MKREFDFSYLNDQTSLKSKRKMLDNLTPKLFKSPATLTILIVCLIYAANQPPLNQVDAALFLSYGPSETPNLYGKGIRDACFVLFHAALFLSLRQLLGTNLYPHIIRRHKIKSKQRFSEQLFSLTYFSPSVLFGIYVSIQQQLWSLTVEDRYPRVQRHANDGNVKFIYLLEMSWWLHEAAALALGLEKKRKDYPEMIVHHLVALSLMIVSYYDNYTDFGLMILVPHGACDVLLCVAKILTYLESGLMTTAWLIFLAVWLYGRHYLMIRGTVIAVRYFRYTATIGQLPPWSILMFFLGCAVALQLLNLFWLTLIVKGMRRAANSEEHHRDIRSDDEGDDMVEENGEV